MVVFREEGILGTDDKSGCRQSVIERMRSSTNDRDVQRSPNTRAKYAGRSSVNGTAAPEGCHSRR
jgi:hypothetical protein